MNLDRRLVIFLHDEDADGIALETGTQISLWGGLERNVSERDGDEQLLMTMATYTPETRRYRIRYDERIVRKGPGYLTMRDNSFYTIIELEEDPASRRRFLFLTVFARFGALPPGHAAPPVPSGAFSDAFGNDFDN